MTYLVDGQQFELSYNDLVSDYYRFCQMPDEEFTRTENLLDAMHFACVVGYLKESGAEATISDLGVIHELIHLAKGINLRNLREIREQFARVMLLA